MNTTSNKNLKQVDNSKNIFLGQAPKGILKKPILLKQYQDQTQSIPNLTQVSPFFQPILQFPPILQHLNYAQSVQNQWMQQPKLVNNAMHKIV